jgi:hypothetical protein
MDLTSKELRDGWFKSVLVSHHHGKRCFFRGSYRSYLDCTPMIGQMWLGESGGVFRCFSDYALIPQTPPVAGSQAAALPV